MSADKIIQAFISSTMFINIRYNNIVGLLH